MSDPAPRTTRLAVLAMALVIFAALLILAAMIFTMLRQTEELLSQNLLADVRTQLLAERGVNLAVERLQAWAASESIDGPHCAWGAVQYRDVNGNGAFDPGLDPVEQYRRGEPLRRMRHPSFAPANPFSLFNEPIRIPDDNGDGHPESIGYSIRYPSTDEDGTDLVSLKVLDCASMIYANGPTAEPGGWALAPNAIRLLNNLGESPEVGIRDLGLMLDAWRRNQRRDLETKRDIVRALRQAGVNERRIEAVRDLLTCHAWVDLRTLHPGALVTATSGVDPPPADKLRWGGLRGRRWGLPTPLQRIWAACGADFLFGEGAGEPLARAARPPVDAPPVPTYGRASLLQPRAPVNVNTAPVEVLAAVFAGLEAIWLDRSARESHALTTSPGRVRRSADAAIDARVARTVAEHVRARRQQRAFRNWEEFDAFILGLPDEDLSPVRKRVLLAAVNPNSRLAAFNSDRAFGLRHGDIDKSALGEWQSGAWDPSANVPFCGWTTELCFSSMGYYQIECLARLLGAPREGIHPVIAERSLDCVARVYDIVRLTTQKDFLARLDSATLLPQGGVAATVGPEPVGGLHRSGWDGPEGLAALCMALPESAAVGKPACNHALCWDGHVSLAPLDPETGPETILAADFASGLEARRGSLIVPALGTADAQRSLLDAADPSELFMDGVFCHETRRSGYAFDARVCGHESASRDEYLGWAAEPAFPEEGSLEMWVKPTWDGDELYEAASPAPGGGREAEDTRTLLSFGRGEGPAGSETGDAGAPGDRLVIFARKGLLAAVLGDSRVASGESPPELRPALVFAVPDRPWCGAFRATALSIRDWRAGEWHHVRVSWTASALWLEADGRRAPGPPLEIRQRPFAAGVPAGWAWFLGSNRFRDGRCNGFPLHADATIDGLVVRAGRPARHRPPPDRYPPGPRPYAFQLRLLPGTDFPCPEPTYTIGTLAWNGRTPASGGGIAVDAGARATNPASLRLPPAPHRASGWTALELELERDSPEGLAVTIALFPCDPGPAGFVPETPILEDVTLTVIGPSRYVSWSLGERR